MSQSNNTKARKQSKKQNPKVTERIVIRERPARQMSKSVNPRVNNGGMIQQLVHAIALYLSAPGEPGVKPFRWASEFSQQETALADPFAIIQPDFGEVPIANSPYFDEKQGAIYLFRGVECGAIVYKQNSAGNVKSYAVQMKVIDEISPTPTIALPLFGEIRLITPYALSTVPTYSPHGPVLYAGAVKGTDQRFLWVDKGDAVTLNLHTLVGTGQFTFIADRYDSKGLNRAVIQNSQVIDTTAGHIVTFKAAGDPAGYYAFRIENGEATPYSLIMEALTIGGAGACLAHIALPDFEKNWLRESGVRVNAASLMYSNTSTVLELGGTVSGVQFGSKTDWMDTIVTDIATYVQGKKGSVTMDVRRGLHGYLKPTQPEDFRIQAYSEIDSNGDFVDSFYPLDDRGSFLCMAITLPGGGKGNEGYVTTRFGIEYLTQDTWASTGPSDVPDEAFKEALGYLKNLDQFHENPLHLKELWSKIKNGAKKAVGFLINKGPGIIKGVQQVSEILGAL